MTHATEIFQAHTSIADKFAVRFAELKLVMQNRINYSKTVRELSALSDYELNDLGIHRASIRHIAKIATSQS